MSKDIRIRSFVKTITWRILATSATICIVYIFTGEAKLATEVGGVTLVSNVILYYIHERLWSKVSWGELKSV
jgi:uncharacterized membrane protein